MSSKSHKETTPETSSTETVKGGEIEDSLADGESGELELPPVERTENYDSDITLSHDVDGFWYWHVGDQRSEVGYHNPALAIQFAPSPARND